MRVSNERARALHSASETWRPDGPMVMSAQEQRLQNECIYELSSDLLDERVAHAKARRRIAELEAQLAEARRDAERLDWLQNHEILPMPITSLTVKRMGGYRVCGKFYDNLRAAIDAAATAAKEKTNG